MLVGLLLGAKFACIYRAVLIPRAQVYTDED